MCGLSLSEIRSLKYVIIGLWYVLVGRVTTQELSNGEEMAEKQTIDVSSEFERRRDQILKDETEAQWNLAKSFEPHTFVYRRADNGNILKVL